MNKTEEIKELNLLGNNMRERRKKIKQDINDYYESLNPRKEEVKKEVKMLDKIAIFLRFLMCGYVGIFLWSLYFLHLFFDSNYSNFKKGIFLFGSFVLFIISITCFKNRHKDCYMSHLWLRDKLNGKIR